MNASVQRTNFSVHAFTQGNKMSPVPMRLRVTPVPIPNTTVKTQAADGTMPVTVWQSRRVPDYKKINVEKHLNDRFYRSAENSMF